MNHITEWGVGIAATLALPFVFKYAVSKLIPMLVAWQLSSLQKLLNAKTGDPALDQFEKDIVMAVVKLAQAKFPASGLGPERKKLVIDFLTSRLPVFRSQESKLSDLIDQLVLAEKEMLNNIKSDVGGS